MYLCNAHNYTSSIWHDNPPLWMAPHPFHPSTHNQQCRCWCKNCHFLPLTWHPVNPFHQFNFKLRWQGFERTKGMCLTMSFLWFFIYNCKINSRPWLSTQNGRLPACIPCCCTSSLLTSPIGGWQQEWRFHPSWEQHQIMLWLPGLW